LNTCFGCLVLFRAMEYKIRYKDQSPVSVEAEALSGLEALLRLGAKALDRVVAVKVNGMLCDLASRVESESELEPVYANSEEGLEILRHSTSHVMAMAVKELFPGVKVTIGPAIENGFYYDFDFERPFKEEDLSLIEERMEAIIKQDLPFTREEITSKEAADRFSLLGETYKVEIIEDLGAEKVSVYTQGNFSDLCKGPHVPSTGRIKAFKLIKTSGAYWRGDEKRAMLSRIYGTAFEDKKLLKQYLQRIEDAKKRDHVKLGRQLDLFNTYDEIGSGMVVWHPKGGILRHLIEDFETKEHLKRGYDIVKGPQILKTELWEKSGHFDHYRENMYFTEIDKQSYGIKPMNCLSHMLIYRSAIRSYRDLPKRYFELGLVHRHERSGVVHGLTRVRAFTQDDAHILCTPEQLDSEIKGVLDFIRDVMAIFGFEYELEISTRPENSIGSDEDWERATNALKKTLEDTSLPFTINEGDGAFYGPKIDIKLKDALERKWQCATVQCDFTLPDRFDLTYVDKDGVKRRPVMIHRVILGSIERFIGIMIEHFAGAFPVWLAPVQAKILTVTDRNIPYGEKLLKNFIDAGIRCESDFRNEKLGLKVREAQMQKIPYSLIIGDRESQDEGVTPRLRDGSNMSFMKEGEFINLIQEQCKARR
jgi:threonyl-tRNA synthetase